MTDQEAFEKWWESRDYDFQESCGWDNGEKVWHAAIAYLRSQPPRSRANE